jgi:hypothetical protein
MPPYRASTPARHPRQLIGLNSAAAAQHCRCGRFYHDPAGASRKPVGIAHPSIAPCPMDTTRPTTGTYMATAIAPMAIDSLKGTRPCLGCQRFAIGLPFGFSCRADCVGRAANRLDIAIRLLSRPEARCSTRQMRCIGDGAPPMLCQLSWRT